MAVRETAARSNQGEFLPYSQLEGVGREGQYTFIHISLAQMA